MFFLFLSELLRLSKFFVLYSQKVSVESKMNNFFQFIRKTVFFNASRSQKFILLEISVFSRTIFSVPVWFAATENLKKSFETRALTWAFENQKHKILFCSSLPIYYFIIIKQNILFGKVYQFRIIRKVFMLNPFLYLFALNATLASKL